jgi:hypothetical protein
MPGVAISQIQYAWRSPTLGIQQQIYTALEKEMNAPAPS